MSKTIKLAREAYDALAPLNNISWQSYREKLLKLCEAEERDHRGFLNNFNDCHEPTTPGIRDCAKLFAVKRIAEYLKGDTMPKGKDFLHQQASCFYAAGLVDEYAQTIRECWKDLSISEIADLNYTTVVKVKAAA